MKRLMLRCAVMAVVMLATNALTAAEPAVKGSVQGIELCPQYICQSAIFVGTFAGTIDGHFAVGSWAVSVTHEEPLPTEAGELKAITGGQWQLTAWVFRGFFPRRQFLSGPILDGGSIMANGNNTFGIVAVLAQSAQAGIALNAVLDHNRFPPTVAGSVLPSAN